MHIPDPAALSPAARARVLPVAAVVALHALIWFAAGLDRKAPAPATDITYADLRFIAPTPAPALQPAAEPVAPAAPAAAPIPRARKPKTPTLANRQAPADEPTTADAAPVDEPAEESAPHVAPFTADETSGPPLNLEALRMAARENERERERSPIEKHRDELRRAQQRDAAAEAIKRSARASCGSAYASMGLLAIIPLVVDTVRDKGCKW